MLQPILTRAGITALRQLKDLMPGSSTASLLDVAEWAIDLATGEAAPHRPDLADEAAAIFWRAADLQPASRDEAPIEAPAEPLTAPDPTPEIDATSVQAGAPASGDAPAEDRPGRAIARDRGWPDADITQLRALVDQGLGWREIGRRMGRHESAVRFYAGRHGIGGIRVPSDWSEEHSATLLRMLAEGAPIGAIAEAVDRSYHAVQSRSRKIRMSAAYKAAIAARQKAPPPPRASVPRKAWSMSEDARLRELIAGGNDFRAIGEAMGRTAQSCEKRAHKLKSSTRAPRPQWTPGDDSRLRSMRDAGHAIAAMAEAFGQSERSIVTRLRKFPVKITATPPAKDKLPAPAPAAPAAASPSSISISTGLSRPASAPAPVSGREHQIEAIRAHLDRLPWDERFDAAKDYQIARRLLEGARSKALAEELGLPLADLVGRFRTMIPTSIRDARGAVTIDGRGLLLEALRRNAEEDEIEA